jgi:hypothetical protein
MTARERLRASRVAAGRCIDCEEPAAGKVRCDPCNRQNVARTMARWRATHTPVKCCRGCGGLGHNVRTCGVGSVA